MTPDNMNDTTRQWIKFEHSRLHCVEEWPQSARKEVVLAAIHASLTRLEQANDAAAPMPCAVCASRPAKSNVLQFPRRAGGLTLVTRPAA